MPNATSRNFRIAYARETVFRTTPSSALTIARSIGGGGQATYQSVESEETHLNEVPDFTRVGAEANGVIPMEYSYGALHDFIPGILGSDWATNVCSVGTTRYGYTIEDQYLDIGRFNPFKGCVITRLAVRMSARQKITAEVNYRPTLIPTAMATATAGTGGPTAAPTNPVLNASTSLQLLQEGGSGTFKVREFSFELTRPPIPSPVCGSMYDDDVDIGPFMARGTAVLQIANSTMADKLMNDTLTSLAYTIGGASTLQDAWLFSKVRLIGGGIQQVSRNSPVLLSLEWGSAADVTNTSCKVTRTPA